MDVGRGSHSVGRIYGDLGDSVCEDIAGSIPCALCVLCTWTLLHVSTLYSLLYRSDDNTRLLCVKTLKLTAGPNGIESRRHGLSWIVHNN